MPTWTFESLATSDMKTLEGVLTSHKAPAVSSLIDWEFKGWNVLAPAAKPVMAALGFQRFAKGFFVRGGGDADSAPYVEGYNVKTKSGGFGDPWTPHEKDGKAVRHSFYRVYKAGEGGERRMNRYPEALFLDYGQGDPPNGLFDGRGIRDFVVAVNPDLLLGKAYFTLGPITTVAGMFIAERLRKAA